MKALSQLDFERFEGIVEADETYFFYSEKGSRKITGRKPRNVEKNQKAKRKVEVLTKKNKFVCWSQETEPKQPL